MVKAMNRFTQQEAMGAKILVTQSKINAYTPEQLEAQAKRYVKQYALSQDQDAAAVALLQLVTELLTQEK